MYYPQRPLLLNQTYPIESFFTLPAIDIQPQFFRRLVFIGFWAQFGLLPSELDAGVANQIRPSLEAHLFLPDEFHNQASQNYATGTITINVIDRITLLQSLTMTRAHFLQNQSVPGVSQAITNGTFFQGQSGLNANSQPFSAIDELHLFLQFDGYIFQLLSYHDYRCRTLKLYNDMAEVLETFQLDQKPQLEGERAEYYQHALASSSTIDWTPVDCSQGNPAQFTQIGSTLDILLNPNNLQTRPHILPQHLPSRLAQFPGSTQWVRDSGLSRQCLPWYGGCVHLFPIELLGQLIVNKKSRTFRLRTSDDAQLDQISVVDYGNNNTNNNNNNDDYNHQGGGDSDDDNGVSGRGRSQRISTTKMKDFNTPLIAPNTPTKLKKKTEGGGRGRKNNVGKGGIEYENVDIDNYNGNNIGNINGNGIDKKTVGNNFLISDDGQDYDDSINNINNMADSYYGTAVLTSQSQQQQHQHQQNANFSTQNNENPAPNNTKKNSKRQNAAQQTSSTLSTTQSNLNNQLQNSQNSNLPSGPDITLPFREKRLDALNAVIIPPSARPYVEAMDKTLATHINVQNATIEKLIQQNQTMLEGVNGIISYANVMQLQLEQMMALQVRQQVEYSESVSKFGEFVDQLISIQQSQQIGTGSGSGSGGSQVGSSSGNIGASLKNGLDSLNAAIGKNVRHYDGYKNGDDGDDGDDGEIYNGQFGIKKSRKNNTNLDEKILNNNNNNNNNSKSSIAFEPLEEATPQRINEFVQLSSSSLPHLNHGQPQITQLANLNDRQLNPFGVLGEVSGVVGGFPNSPPLFANNFGTKFGGEDGFKIGHDSSPQNNNNNNNDIFGMTQHFGGSNIYTSNSHYNHHHDNIQNGVLFVEEDKS